MISINKRNDQWWTFKLKGLSYGSTDIFSSGMHYAIIDSGTSLITIPLSDYNNFKQQIINANTSLNCNSATKPYCFSKTQSCSSIISSLRPLVFKLDNLTFTIPPSVYAVDGMLNNACTIAVSYSSNDSTPFIFGDPFLRSFYTTFNFKKDRVELAVSA